MGRVADSKRAKLKGQARARRRKRAERRIATAPVRQAINEKRRAEGHPGWVANPPWWMTSLPSLSDYPDDRNYPDDRDWPDDHD